MNDNHPRPDRPQQDWLAAYADGELDVDARRAVEEWLACDENARENASGQESLSPRNETFWAAVSYPQPTADTWRNTLANIERGLDPPAPVPAANRRAGNRKWWLAGALAVATTAAAVVVAVMALNRALPPGAASPIEVVEDDDLDRVFQVATGDDVEIISLPEEARALLVVGRHPLSGTVVKPAGFADVDLMAIHPDARGDFPELHMTPHGVDAPMIWAPPVEEK